MEALDKINEFKMNSTVAKHMEDTLDNYKLYLKNISQLSPKYRGIYFNVLKSNEIVNNQEMEHEDPFLIQLDLQNPNGKKTSIDIITEMILNDKDLNVRKLEQLHRLIIHKTADDKPENYKIRDTEVYVSEVSNGTQKLCYYAPSPDEIKEYLKTLFAIVNKSDISDEKEVLYNSFLAHFYIAALQPFGNGNTRLARLIEYGNIFRLSRDVLGSKIESPALFLTKNYLLSRSSYRENISLLVNSPTDKSFNKYIDYNLNMMDEQLFYCDNVLEKSKKRGF